MVLWVPGVPLFKFLICLLLLPTEVTSTSTAETVKVSTIPVFPAIPRSKQSDDFEVLVRVEALPMAKRAVPIDLVAVLDVSGSMNDVAAAAPLGGGGGGSRSTTRLDLVKRAMEFVIGKLDDDDRLAIVAFNDQVVHEYSTELLRISGDGRRHARRKVAELVAGGRTAFRPALERAAKILEERAAADSNRVGFVLLLSDGIDKSEMKWSQQGLAVAGKKSRIRAALRKFPVHTFGFGASHDPKALLFIAQESRGTYSFIDDNHEESEVGVDLGSGITAAFAVCLGGLKTVVAVDARVKLTAAELGGVRIGSIASGGYRSHVSGDGASGEIVIGVLYAGEAKSFIVRLQVPAFDDAAGGRQQLLVVLAAGVVSAEAEAGAGAGHVLSVHRTATQGGLGLQDDGGHQQQAAAASPAVVNHIVRFELLEVMSKFVVDELEELLEKQAAAVGGGGGVVDLGSRLQSRWEEFKGCHRFWAGVDLGVLERDVSEMASSLRLRRHGGGAGGAAYVYSWVSSYQMQRATTMGSAGKVVAEFLTQEMRLMLKQAQEEVVAVEEEVEEPNGRDGRRHRPPLIPPPDERGEEAAERVGPRPRRGGSGSSCDCDVTMEMIRRRLEQWSELKREAALLFQASEAADSPQHVSAVLREASLDAINRAMHHDLYLALVHASSVRRGAAAAC